MNKENTFDAETGTFTYNGGRVFARDFGFLHFPDHVQTIIISPGVLKIGGEAFYDMRNATSVTIPDSVTTIGQRAFLGCRSLTTIVIPDSVTRIEFKAFYYCVSLKSITIPDTRFMIRIFGDIHEWLTTVILSSKCTDIVDRAFNAFNSLESITIEDSITTIGEDIFDNNDRLRTIFIKASTREKYETLKIELEKQVAKLPTDVAFLRVGDYFIDTAYFRTPESFYYAAMRRRLVHRPFFSFVNTLFLLRNRAMEPAAGQVVPHSIFASVPPEIVLYIAQFVLTWTHDFTSQ